MITKSQSKPGGFMKKVAIVAFLFSLLFCVNLSGFAQTGQTGNLRPIQFAGSSSQSRYTINGTVLQKLSDEPIELVTSDGACKAAVAFSKTVVVNNGKPVDDHDGEILKAWAKNPAIEDKLKNLKRENAALKQITYSQRDSNCPQIREQVAILISQDPDDKKYVGKMAFGPMRDFSEPVPDLQSRRLRVSEGPINKIILQILWVQDHGQQKSLGAFVIVAKTSGEYEFHLVPRTLLDQLVIVDQKLVAAR